VKEHDFELTVSTVRPWERPGRCPECDGALPRAGGAVAVITDRSGARVTMHGHCADVVIARGGGRS